MPYRRIILEAFLTSLILSIGWQIYTTLHFVHFLNEALYLAAGFHLASYLVFLIRGGAKTSPPTDAKNRHAFHAATLANEWGFAVILVVALEISMFKAGFTYRSYLFHIGLYLFLLALIASLAWRQRREKKLFFAQIAFLAGSIVLGADLIRSLNPPPLEDSMILQPPFANSFMTLNGGNTHLQNMHYQSTPPFYVGIFAAAENPFRDPDPTVSDAEFHSLTLGEPVFAPAEGTVHEVVSDLPDMKPGQSDYNHLLGNYIIMRIAPDRYLYLTNLQQSSPLVEAGDKVQAGQQIASAGSSGKTTQSALFMTLMDRPNLFDPAATSIPFYIADVERNGDESTPGPFFPVRNDFFTPLPR